MQIGPFRAAVLGLTLFLTATLRGQISTSPVEGLRDNTPRLHALVHARIVLAPGKILEKGSIVIQDGVILSVGPDSIIPADARVWDCQGKTIYAGFIDSYSRLGLPKDWQPLPDRPPKKTANELATVGEDAAAPSPSSGASHWNPRVTPERNVADVLSLDPDEMEKTRNLGFAAAWIVPGRGIFRGSSALVHLDDPSLNKALLKTGVAQHVAFEYSDEDSDSYPDSLMGCIALIRQTWLDAQWQSAVEAQTVTGRERPEANAALDSLAAAAAGKQTVVLETGDELDLLRMEKIADEFHLQSVLLGNGYEYRVLGELQKKKIPLILPLAFPEVPEIETPEKALDVSLAALEHWDEAPDNAAKVAAAKIPFALTTSGLADPAKDFWPRLRLAIKRGLAESDALAALTTEPATLTGTSNRLGTLEAGKIADLVIASGDLFTDPDAEILSVWVDGHHHDTDAAQKIDLRGTWQFTWSNGFKAPTQIIIEGKPAAPEAKIGNEKLTLSLDERQLTLLASTKAFGQTGEGTIRLSGLINGEDGAGSGQAVDGTAFTWSAHRSAPFLAKIDKTEAVKPAPLDQAEPIPAVYPAGEYGLPGPPVQPADLFVHNATIWTSGPDGRLANADLLVHQGKIAQVGQNLTAPPGALVIDATGKQVTPGIVDLHSHTAISRGVNEATSAVTCEVRVGDVIDSTDIALYRELAGGVTTINQLHGSANPMGGQNSVLKLRWGSLPDDLKFAGAMPGVKFALGENVKQSNWGDKFTTRYPQTRMGVYQIMRDTFLAAQDYEKQLAAAKASGQPFRCDLRLEAVVEILHNQRIIHIHSYRQDEILAFIRLAAEFKITVAAFHHVLEGYKIADEIAKSGAGGSTFADWWGYKVEAYDAIPENGTLMHEAGVLVSFNSDSNELARRLNVDAAKAVKYGGLTEEEALKFITINPARQLRIDQQVGSLEVGKDADFVIWSGSPLSTYSRAEQTWIDGRKYFDVVDDRKMQQDAEVLREKLIQKALPERLKALGSGSDDGKGDSGDDEDSPSIREMITQQRRLHWWNEYQSLYNAGHDLHTCTNPAHQWR